MEDFISIKTVSQITGISKSTLYKMCAACQFPHYKPRGKLLFKHTEILDWIERGKVETYYNKQS